MAKKVAETRQNKSMSVCIEKFVAYAAPRHITLIPETYGFYEVRRGDTKKILGAVKATKEDGTTGWVINWADRQRKFIADTDKNVIVGKKVSAEACHKARKHKKAAPVLVEDE